MARKYSPKSHLENLGPLRPNASHAPDERGDTGLPQVAVALLNTISGPESGGQYNVIYGGAHANNYEDHPRIYRKIESGPKKGYYSSAAGKYQFVGTTWDKAKAALDLPDFSPASQDKAAWWLAQKEYQEKTGRNLQADLESGDPDTLRQVPVALHGQWDSLPGGGQPGTTSDRFAQVFNNNLTGVAGHPVPPRGIATDPVVPATPTGAMQAGRGEHYFEPLPAPAPLRPQADTAAKGIVAAGSAGSAIPLPARTSPPELQTLPPPPIAAAPEPGNGVWWVTQDEQPNMNGRGLPAGYSDDQLGLAPVAAPQPMPGRPAAIDAARVAPAPAPKAAPKSDDGDYAVLESGKRIKVGTYPSKNPGSSVTITRGPDGKAVIRRNDPGIINPAKELGGHSIVGQMATQMAKDKAAEALGTVQNFAPPSQVSDAVTAIQDATSNSGEKLTDAMVGATQALGNFFGMGGDKPPANVPVKSGTKTLQDIHDARDDGTARPPPTRAMQPVMPQGGPGTFPVAPNYQFGLSDAPGSEQPKLPIVKARAQVEAPPAPSGSRPAQTVIVGQDGSVRPVQQTSTVAMGAKAPASISQPTSAQLGLGEEPPNLAIVKAKVPDAAGGVAASIPKYITTTQQVAIAPTPQAMATLDDIHDRNDDRIVAAQAAPPQPSYRTVTTSTLNPEWVAAQQQQAQGGAPTLRNRPTALTTPVAYKGTSTGKVYDVGSTVKASGGRQMTVQSDGSFKDNKTGQVSAGSSGKRYALLEEAGAYD